MCLSLFESGFVFEYLLEIGLVVCLSCSCSGDCVIVFVGVDVIVGVCVVLVGVLF